MLIIHSFDSSRDVVKSIYPEWKFNERFDLPTYGEEPYSLLVVDGKYYPSMYNEGKLLFPLKGQCSRFPQKAILSDLSDTKP